MMSLVNCNIIITWYVSILDLKQTLKKGLKNHGITDLTFQVLYTHSNITCLFKNLFLVIIHKAMPNVSTVIWLAFCTAGSEKNMWRFQPVANHVIGERVLNITILQPIRNTNRLPMQPMCLHCLLCVYRLPA